VVSDSAAARTHITYGDLANSGLTYDDLANSGLTNSGLQTGAFLDRLQVASNSRPLSAGSQ
jgi:hypothetical protein